MLQALVLEVVHTKEAVQPARGHQRKHRVALDGTDTPSEAFEALQQPPCHKTTTMAELRGHQVCCGYTTQVWNLECSELQLGDSLTNILYSKILLQRQT